MGQHERDLQFQTKAAYKLLPVTMSTQDLLAFNREHRRRESSEYYEKLAEKLKGLIENSPTTQSFKRTLTNLTKRLITEGTVNFKERTTQKWGTLLIDALALDHPEGIYDPETAKQSELKLRNATLISFMAQIRADEKTGQNIRESNFWDSPLFEDFDSGRTLLLTWRSEFRSLYGQSPATPEISEVMEDLIFKGPPNS